MTQLIEDIKLLCLYHPDNETKNLDRSETFILSLKIEEDLFLRLFYNRLDENECIKIYWVRDNTIVRCLYRAFTHNFRWEVHEYHKGDWEILVRNEAEKIKDIPSDYATYEKEDLFSPDTTWTID